MNMNNKYRELGIDESDISNYFYRNNYSTKEMKVSCDLRTIILYNNKKGIMNNRQCIRLENIVTFRRNKESEERREWF